MSKKDLQFDESLFKHPFIERSTHKVVFSQQRVEYLRSIEAFAKKACALKKIEYGVNYEEAFMEVATTAQTRDPYIIIKASDMIQLLSRGVPLEYAAKVLDDDVFSEIIYANLLCSNEKTFERRRNRLSNPKIIKAVELLTKCRIFISGKTVCVVGNYRGINDAKNIIVLCFENVHPVLEIKRLMIKKKLEKDNVEGSWDRFLPTAKRTHSKNKSERREAGGLPEEIRPRKEDLARETGEYYADKNNLEKDRAREERRIKRDMIRKAKQERFVVPEE